MKFNFSLLYIETPPNVVKPFSVAVRIRDGVVFEAPPIVHYMKGWTHEQVLSYCKYRRWEVTT